MYQSKEIKHRILLIVLYMVSTLFFYRFFETREQLDRSFLYIEGVNLLFFFMSVIIPIYFFTQLMRPEKYYIMRFIISLLPIASFVMLLLSFLILWQL
jgi:hypothetical protein